MCLPRNGLLGDNCFTPHNITRYSSKYCCNPDLKFAEITIFISAIFEKIFVTLNYT